MYLHAQGLRIGNFHPLDGSWSRAKRKTAKQSLYESCTCLHVFSLCVDNKICLTLTITNYVNPLSACETQCVCTVKCAEALPIVSLIVASHSSTLCVLHEKTK